MLAVGGGGTAASQNVAYDAFGNILTLTNNGVARATPTSSSTNRLTGSVAYDGPGNLHTWNFNEYRYDPLGSRWVWQAPQPGEYWLDLYTADDERIWAYDLARNQSYWAIRGLDGRVLREYFNNAGTWSVLHDYVYAGDKLIATETASGRRYMHTDHLGTVRQVTNAAGAQVAYHVYFPFGEEATAFNQDSEQMKWTGHERDFGNPTGAGDDLDYMHARFCSPLTARFLGVDPVGSTKPAYPQSWNRYAYVRSNPLKYLDPDGKAETLATHAYEQDEAALGRGEISVREFQQRIEARASGMFTGLTLLGDVALARGVVSGGVALMRNLGFGALKGGGGRELFRDALSRVVRSSGSAGKKADLFERYSTEISSRTGGAWSATRAAGADGSHIFVGSQGHILVVNSQGQVFQGTIQAIQVGQGGAITPIYDLLRLVAK